MDQGFVLGVPEALDSKLKAFGVESSTPTRVGFAGFEALFSTLPGACLLHRSLQRTLAVLSAESCEVAFSSL